jgi:hypothetical protein
MVLFDVSKNRWSPVFHLPQKSIKEPPVLVIKNPESKNQPVWVFKSRRIKEPSALSISKP